MKQVKHLGNGFVASCQTSDACITFDSWVEISNIVMWICKVQQLYGIVEFNIPLDTV